MQWSLQSFWYWASGSVGGEGVQKELERAQPQEESSPDTRVHDEALEGLPVNWREGMLVGQQGATGTRSDNAKVPIYLWNDRLMEGLGLEAKCTETQCEALEIIRRGVLRTSGTRPRDGWKG